MYKYLECLSRIVAFIVFVALAKAFWGFDEVDRCLDLGGTIDRTAGICVGSEYGQWSLASERHFLSWLTTLGVPALVIWGLYALIVRFAKRLGTRKSA